MEHQQSTFIVQVRTLHGTDIPVHVCLDDTVKVLKARLSFAPEEIRLIYEGRQMEDERSLRDYGITPNCTIFQILRVSGIQEECLLTLPGSLTDKASGKAEKSKSELQLDSSPKQSFLCCVREALPEVTPEIIQNFPKDQSYYRVHLPGAGSFQCSVTGLGFEAKSAVSIQYRYASWNSHLSAAAQEEWVVAGPLFCIMVQPGAVGAVGAVYLPHFVCLAGGVDVSLCRIAHFKSGKMSLEKPTKLNAFCAVLENPSFSLLGVLWRKLRSTLYSLPMHSLVLIFQQLSAANTTLHLYLIPDDNSVKQAIEEQEMNWNSKLIPKPPPLNPLFFGCSYQVSSTSHVVITPGPYLPFCYKGPKEQQLFIEIYIRNMAEEIWLLITNERDGTLVWKASLRSGDINLPTSASQTLSGAVFIKKHKMELCHRMGRISPILLHLRDANIINSDEEEEVQSQSMSQNRKKVLLQLVEKKGSEAQEQLYKILWKKDPFLITDLESKSS
ncbi:caspase recruitment domain-containing protein 8 isoform X2 [Struthio camelus]|uniref:caspase recruitment domain-containing protein 8 isoform X2 n=1 Tax=Struthio camelus TaxID=8801 RepID=UPI00360424E1